MRLRMSDRGTDAVGLVRHREFVSDRMGRLPRFRGRQPGPGYWTRDRVSGAVAGVACSGHAGRGGLARLANVSRDIYWVRPSRMS
jgi:hypothetical protein